MDWSGRHVYGTKHSVCGLSYVITRSSVLVYNKFKKHFSLVMSCWYILIVHWLFGPLSDVLIAFPVLLSISLLSLWRHLCRRHFFDLFA
jgi:hypothetical protein